MASIARSPSRGDSRSPYSRRRDVARLAQRKCLDPPQRPARRPPLSSEHAHRLLVDDGGFSRAPISARDAHDVATVEMN